MLLSQFCQERNSNGRRRINRPDRGRRARHAIALDPRQPAAARVTACREVLDRGHGRARQGIELTGAAGERMQIDNTQAAREHVLAMLDEVAERTASADAVMVAVAPPSTTADATTPAPAQQQTPVA